MIVRTKAQLDKRFHRPKQLVPFAASWPASSPVATQRKKAIPLIKQDLIQRVVERTGLPRVKAESAVDAIFEAMKTALGGSDRIELRGFGVFTVKPRKTGVGRNPRTGTEVTINPGKAVRFKPGKELQILA
jgi:nucleoid DNA-binding protein